MMDLSYIVMNANEVPVWGRVKSVPNTQYDGWTRLSISEPNSTLQSWMSYVDLITS